MTAPLLSVRDLRTWFHTSSGIARAVDGVSFDVMPHETVGVVGESGCGKSVTSLSILRLIDRPGSIEPGSVIEFEGRDLMTLPEKEMRKIRGNRISMIFQEPMTSLNPVFTVGDQVAEVARVHSGASKREAWERAVEMLATVGMPAAADRAKEYPHQLSGGLRQRVMIAMALMMGPALLIADEPTTALDVTIQAQILQLIQQLQGELHMAVLLITHDLGVVANMAEEVVVMYRGRVTESGAIGDIFGSPRHPYLKALMRAVPRFDMRPGERLTPIRDIQVTGEHLITSGSGKFKPYGGALLEVRNLTKRYAVRKRSFLGPKSAGELLAVDDLSLAVAQGECLGLVGESGCGKTTTAKMILRSVAPDSGEIFFKNQDALAFKAAELFAYRRKVQFVFQDPFASLNPRMTALDIISEPLVIHRIGDPEERFARVKELMGLVGLDVRYLRRYPHSFSGGQRQRIGIARALALGPELLICDEPVSALDVSVQAQVLNLLSDLRSALGLTYIFISHNLAVVNYLADRIAVMCAGRLVELAPAGELFRNPSHPYTRALLAAVPEPNLARKLDFAALMQGKASDPAAWSPAFRIVGSDRPPMLDLGNGHYVRAREGVDAKELAA
jgi:peptide/nickel transport system ATP-binding protein